MEVQSENYAPIDFCRLCIRIIIDAKISFEDTYVLTIVKNFFPRLDLNLFEAPLICKICLEDLITAFKVQKLISNKLVVNRADTKLMQNLCFLCLTPQKIRKIAKKNSDVRIVLDKLFQNLHLNVKPTVKKTLLVCPTCTDIANGIIGSLEHLLQTGLKITTYCKKYKIDKLEKPRLQDLHRYVNDLSDDPLVLNNDIELVQPFSDLKLENGEQSEPVSDLKEDPLTLTEPDPLKDVPLALDEPDPLEDVPDLIDKKDFKENDENIALEETEIIVIMKYNNEEYYVKATRFKNTHFQTCPVCSHSTARLVGHMKRQHSKGYQGIFFKCPLCPYQTKNKGDLRGGHALTHKTTESCIFECPHCEYKAKRKPHLERHMLALHNNATEEYSCPECPYKTKMKAYLQSHAKVHQTPDMDTIIHKCPHCLYQTTRKKHLSRHLNIHKDKAELNMLKCPHCQYETFDRNHLKSHMKCKHTNPDDIVWFNCDFCTYKTKYQRYIAQHVALVHTINKKQLPLLKCLQCDYSTTQKAYLKNHIAYTHQGMKPFKCTKCPLTTKCKSYFNKHMQIKHEKVDFPKVTCQICQYKTISRGRLNRHLIAVHDAGRKYRCGTCSALFKYKGDYLKHQRKKGHDVKIEK